MTPLDRAIAVAGSVAAFASGIGVSASTPSMWRARGSVPADKCPAIERFTRERGAVVMCEELCPEVPWSVLRERGAPADAQPQPQPEAA